MTSDGVHIYDVYEHIFPNGKRYIGISKDPERRWNGGHGYDEQPKMCNAIKCYGWQNIEHNIIVSGVTQEQAQALERRLIEAYDAIENGYNTAIGGDTVLSTYLNPHIMAMIRASDKYDRKLGEECVDGDIVSIAKEAKFDADMAKALNSADEKVVAIYDEYKSSAGRDAYYSTDCYWWTMAQILAGGEEKLQAGLSYSEALMKWLFSERSES